jgi:hypothetical protein
MGLFSDFSSIPVKDEDFFAAEAMKKTIITG